MTEPTAPTPTPTIVSSPSINASVPSVATAQVRFREIQATLLAASRDEIKLTLAEVGALVREQGLITHQLQSTSATGPKREAKPKVAKAKKPAAPKRTDIDTSSFDDLD